MQRTRKALFLDRDGVINREAGFLSQFEQVEWVEGIFELAREARRREYCLVVVTNQSGIGRGLYSRADFELLMQHVNERFQHEGTPLAAVYDCPFHPEHGLGDYRREHPDRKPQPGMLLRAATDLGLDLQRSIMVGDRCSDILAANAAGLRQAFLLQGTESAPCTGKYCPVTTLSEVERWLRRAEDEANVEVV